MVVLGANGNVSRRIDGFGVFGLSVSLVTCMYVCASSASDPQAASRSIADRGSRVAGHLYSILSKTTRGIELDFSEFVWLFQTFSYVYIC